MRRKKRVVASTRTQALQALSAIKGKVQIESLTGVKQTSDITTVDLFARFKRYQKARLKPTTYERLDGVGEALKRVLPAQAQTITKRSVAEYIEARYACVKPATITKESSHPEALPEHGGRVGAASEQSSDRGGAAAHRRGANTISVTNGTEGRP